jgi:SWI/SNF-related matrix-associated actin-dependent regulator 1 of chromatin subfamily A
MRFTVISGGRWALHAAYDGSLVKACKPIPGLLWNPKERQWEGYPDAWAEVHHAGLQAALQEHTEGLSLDPSVPVYSIGGFDTRLRKYQIHGAAEIAGRSHNGFLLADGMGFGKTAQAIQGATHRANSIVVVCPSFVRGVWGREFKKWAPTWKPEFPEGVKIPCVYGRETPAIVIHYDILYAWVDAIKEWAESRGDGLWLILDECHFIASEKARRSQACKQLAKAATHRVGLSGTPLTSHVKDLWNVVDTLSPGRFGGYFKFCLRYCDAHQVQVGSGPLARTVWDFSGRSNLDELKRRMGHFMLRRTHADVNLELPPLTRQVVELKVPVKSQMSVALGSNKVVLRKALDLAADAKLKEVIAMCAQHLEDGHSVVVGCHRRSVAEHIANALEGDYIHGGLSMRAREEVLAKLRGGEGPQLLAATIDSVQVGVDLTFADVVVFSELTWEPHELAQFEARVFRFGQTKTTLVQYCIALKTGDELIRDGVISKLEEVSAPVLGSDGTNLSEGLRGTKTDDEALEEFWKGLGQ